MSRAPRLPMVGAFRTPVRALVPLCLLWAFTTLAGSQPRYGGTMKVAAVVRSPQASALLADTPVEATLHLLAATPLCRAASASWVKPQVLRLEPRPPFTSGDLTRAIERAATDTSPYRGLLAALSQVAPDGSGVVLTFEATWPDAERALCHPALSVARGPFTPKGSATSLESNPAHPDGRPYVDGVTVQPVDRRQAERLFTQRRVHVTLGASTALEGPQLYATYLVPSPRLPPTFMQSVEATVDRADLVRFFVAAPAAPLFGLLPPGLGGPSAAGARPARPAPLSPPREVTVLYDASLGDQRAVAERLQVKLQPLGYRVAVLGLPRAQLRARWKAGTFDVLLFGVLLPPAPAPALTVAMEVAGQRARAVSALAASQAQAEPGARDAQAVAASAGLRDVPLVPLYVQGLAVVAATGVQHLAVDEQGLLRLDDAFLAEE